MTSTTSSVAHDVHVTTLSYLQDIYNDILPTLFLVLIRKQLGVATTAHNLANTLGDIDDVSEEALTRECPNVHSTFAFEGYMIKQVLRNVEDRISKSMGALLREECDTLLSHRSNVKNYNVLHDEYCHLKDDDKYDLHVADSISQVLGYVALKIDRYIRSISMAVEVQASFEARKDLATYTVIPSPILAHHMISRIGNCKEAVEHVLGAEAKKSIIKRLRREVEEDLKDFLNTECIEKALESESQEH